jgi:integrase
VRPKSKAGTRTVPIIDRLAVLLADHRVLTNHPAAGLLFTSHRKPDQPLHPVAMRRRLHRAWQDAKLDRLGLHEARHTFASIMVAAGVNAKAAFAGREVSRGQFRAVRGHPDVVYFPSPAASRALSRSR